MPAIRSADLAETGFTQMVVMFLFPIREQSCGRNDEKWTPSCTSICPTFPQSC